MIRPPSARNQPGSHKHFWPSDVLPPRLEGAVGYICKKKSYPLPSLVTASKFGCSVTPCERIRGSQYLGLRGPPPWDNPENTPYPIRISMPNFDHCWSNELRRSAEKMDHRPSRSLKVIESDIDCG